LRGFWLLVHVLGFTLWLGGGIATMVAGVSAKGFAAAERLALGVQQYMKNHVRSASN